MQNKKGCEPKVSEGVVPASPTRSGRFGKSATVVLRQWRGSFLAVVRENFSSGAANFFQWREKILAVVRQIFSSGGSFVWSGRGRLDRFAEENLFVEFVERMGLFLRSLCA